MAYEFEIIGRGTVQVTNLDLMNSKVSFIDSVDGAGSCEFVSEGFPTYEDAQTAIEAHLGPVDA